MLNKVDYWLGLCEDDLNAADAMLKSKIFLWVGFICHIIVEKALKAVYASISNETPPKTHDLSKLAALSSISQDLSEEHKKLLNKLTPLQIEARYPEQKENIKAMLTEEICDTFLKDTEEFLKWIKR